MFETMYMAEGIGLAAPQVGISVRLFVMDVGDDEVGARAVVNPTIVEQEGSEREDEGCLSLPGMFGSVDRAKRIVLEGQDPDGQPIRIETEDLVARCIQHELDHVNGVLFIDHLSPIKRRMLLNKWKKQQKEEARR
jgi:peptide deformylase